MVKRSVLFIACVLFLTITIGPSYTLAEFYVIPVNNSPLTGAQKSICEYPYWQTADHIDGGNFEVRYDPRSYDPDYYSSAQRPPGGIRFEFWLGTFTSAAARDTIVDKISKLVLNNNDTGTYHEMTVAEKFEYFGDPSGSYGIYLGHQNDVLGTWDIVIVAEGKKYAGSFTLTQAMVSRTRPIPVDPVVTSDGSQFTVTAPLTNGDKYRFRIWDENYYIIFQEDMTIDTQAGTATSVAPLQYADYTARIETRVTGDQWLALMSGGDLQTCNANGGVPGAGTARYSTWFKIQVVP
jgi:hypothetical protein